MRDSDGKFQKGNPGGPGRPRRAIEREYLAELSNAITLAKWSKIVERAAEDACKGDARAREWLSRYLLGQPVGKEPLLNLATRERSGKTIESIVDGSHYQDRFLSSFKLDDDL